ncbi:MAG: regulatory protein RecX [Parachlamydiales bacterium]|nr:regulatory protein RecX [Parachlamydiales bacterium]
MQFGSHTKETNPFVLVITINDQPFKEVSKKLFGKSLEFPLKCSSWEEAREWFDSLEYRVVKKYCVTLLAMRNYPSDGLRQKLRSKNISDTTMEKVITELQEHHYLNDEEWLEHFIHQQVHKGYGPNGIAAKLRQKYIAQNKIEDSLNKIMTAQMQKKKIVDLLMHDFQAYPKEKAMRLLQRRGFDPFLIYEVVKNPHDRDSGEME